MLALFYLELTSISIITTRKKRLIWLIVDKKIAEMEAGVT